MNYTLTNRFELGFYTDDSPGIIVLARVLVDGTEYPCTGELEVRELRRLFPWFPRLERRLELVLAKGPLGVSPVVMEALREDNLTALQMIAQPLGRAQLREGLYWFCGEESVECEYDTVYGVSVPPPGRNPADLDAAYLDLIRYPGPGGSWLMPWQPCSPNFQVQASFSGGLHHAEVLATDGHGNTGCGVKTFRGRTAADVDKAFTIARRRALEDYELMASSGLFEVTTEAGTLHYLCNWGDHRTQLPVGFTEWGWQGDASGLKDLNLGGLERALQAREPANSMFTDILNLWLEKLKRQ